MLDVSVIEDPAAAAIALDPVKSRLLAELAKPASAANLATRLGIARQKINYHLRALESHNLVEMVEQRRWGGLTERLYVATACSYVVSPQALGRVAADPARTSDRFSASYVIALAARVVREVGALFRVALRSQKRLATLSIDTEIRFASPQKRTAFTEELAQTLTELIARYHEGWAPGGREFRVVLMAYPKLNDSTQRIEHDRKER